MKHSFVFKSLFLAVFWLSSTSIILILLSYSITQNQRTQATQCESSGVDYYLSNAESNICEDDQSVGNASYLGDETEISDEEIEESER